MNITTGTIVTLGPKASTNREYRVAETETLRSSGMNTRSTKVTLERVSDGSRWAAYIKPNAKRIAWNTTLMSVVTDADRRESIRKNMEDLGINEGNSMTDQLNISNRVQWSEIVDEGPAITREGEVFQFLSGGYVQVNFKEGTEDRSKAIHRDRLTKI